MSFYALQVLIEQVYHALAVKMYKLFWTRMKDMSFALAAKQFEHLESRSNLFVHKSRILNASTLRVLKLRQNGPTV